MAEHEHRNAQNAAVVHNPAKQRFEINMDGQLSVLEYTFKNHRLFLMHTEVPPALQSQGLGTELAHAALEYARQNELTVIAICPFVQEYVSGHPEYQSFVITSVAWTSILLGQVSNLNFWTTTAVRNGDSISVYQESSDSTEMAEHFEDALISVWRQTLVQNAKTVELGGRHYFVKRTSRHRFRQVDFTFDGQRLRGLEQNPETSSRWAKLARQGKKVMQFLREGRYVAVVVDGQVFTYGRDSSPDK